MDMEKMQVTRFVCLSFQPFEQSDQRQECSHDADRKKILRQARGKDQQKTFSFYEGRKARNTKRHHEQSNNLPALQFVAASRRTEIKGNSYDGAQSARGQPELWALIEIFYKDHQIPNEIAPKNDSVSRKRLKVTH